MLISCGEMQVENFLKNEDLVIVIMNDSGEILWASRPDPTIVAIEVYLPEDQTEIVGLAFGKKVLPQLSKALSETTISSNQKLVFNFANHSCTSILGNEITSGPFLKREMFPYIESALESQEIPEFVKIIR